MTTKMMKREEEGVSARPHAQFKQDILDQIKAFSPASVLDIGCGDGQLLRTLAGLDIHECVGVEVDSDAVSTLAAQGFDARLGRAESLAFPDASFDVVVLDYVAHHIEHLQRGLIEAARVARKAVIVLDPWYDLSIASQRVAHDFDLWSKCIDRRLGMIHDPSVSAAQLARPFNGLGDWRLDCRYRLILQLVSLETIETQARHQLDAIGSCRQAEDALEVLLDRAREHGFSDDGMILFSANRISSQTLNI